MALAFLDIVLMMVNWVYYGNARSNIKTRTDKFGGRFTASVTLHTQLYSVRILETSRREQVVNCVADM